MMYISIAAYRLVVLRSLHPLLSKGGENTNYYIFKRVMLG